MSDRRIRHLRTVAFVTPLALLPVALLATPALAAAPANVKPTRAVTVTSSGQIDIATKRATWTTIDKVSLPAGTWVLSSSATLVDFDAAQIARCGLVLGSSFVDTSAQTVGTYDYAETISDQAVVAVSGSRSEVFLRCEHDQPGSAPYVDPGATLSALLTTNAVDTATTAQSTPVPANGLSEVLSTPEPKGTDLVLNKVTPVDLDGDSDEEVDCVVAGTKLASTTSNVDGEDVVVSSAGSGQPVATQRAVDVDAAGAHGGVATYCGSTQPNAYADSGASLISTPAPGATYSDSDNLQGPVGQGTPGPISLPAGHWMAYWGTSADFYGDSSGESATYVRCALTNSAGTALSGSNTVYGDSSSPAAYADSNGGTELTQAGSGQAAFSTSGADTVHVTCTQDDASADVDINVQLVVVPVRTVSTS